MIIITITAEPGDTIYDTATEASRVATDLQREVTIVFNDTPVTVYPGSFAQNVVKEWERIREERAKERILRNVRNAR